MRTISILGSSCIERPGLVSLETSFNLLAHTGSVNILSPFVWIRKVECPIHVTVVFSILLCKNALCLTGDCSTKKEKSFFVLLSFFTPAYKKSELIFLYSHYPYFHNALP